MYYLFINWCYCNIFWEVLNLKLWKSNESVKSMFIWYESLRRIIKVCVIM